MGKLWGMVRAASVVLSCVLWGCGSSGEARFPDQAELDRLAGAMTFYASFEDGMDAAQARDDRRIYSAPSYDELADRGPWYWGQNVSTAYDAGAAGHALLFNGELTQALFYSADGNVPWSAGGSISFWIKPGEYAGTPITIVPADAGGSAISVALRSSEVTVMSGGQVIPADVGAVAGESWLHVVVSLEFDGGTTLFVDGAERGTGAIGALSAKLSTIRLGVGYVGLIDELAVFERVLTADEVRFLHETPDLPASLMR
jgi:hypothetical protein